MMQDNIEINDTADIAAQKETITKPLMVIGALFFIFGMVTWLNGSLIPYLKRVCNLTNAQALLVTFAFYIAYTVMALPMSRILTRTGYRKGMAVGLGIMACAALLHIPAALNASFPLFLVALFMLGAGLTILQTASNPYLVLLGPIESAATRISLMGILNKGAGVFVPLIFTAIILNGLQNSGAVGPNAAELAHKLIIPYLIMCILLLGLLALVLVAPLPEVTPAPAPEGGHDKSLMEHPQLVLGVLTLFGYVGVEVLAGDTIGLFGQNLGLPDATRLTAYTMTAMVLGYCIGILCIPRWVSQRLALTISGIVGLIAVMGILFSSGHSNIVASRLWGWSGIPTLPDPVFFVAAMGLANALVWPALWPMALSDLGGHTPRASALLIMSISGGALLPLVFGWASTNLASMQTAYAVALPCYAMIVFYAVKGSQMRAWRKLSSGEQA